MIGNTFNLKQLEALVWVAELGSFRKAAAHLGTTQPNISSRIAALERTLGVVLMLRDAGSIQLTDKGQEILKAARKVLRDAEQIVEIAERQDLITDRLRLGVTELIACTWLHSYLRAVKAAYPALNIELTVDLSRQLDSELSANRLDLTLQNAPFSSAASGVLPLGQTPYIWVAAPVIARSLNSPCKVADLLPHSVLAHARHSQAYIELANHIQQNALPTQRIVSSNSLSSCVQMATDGMGVTLLPKALMANELARKALIELEVDWHPSPLKFAARYHKEKAPRFLGPVAQMAAVSAAAFLDV